MGCGEKSHSFYFFQPKLTNLSCWALAGTFWFHWNVRFNRGQRYSSWTGVSHHGRELAAPLADPVGRTYTCSSPASSPPPYKTNHPRVTTMAPSRITTSQLVTAGINKAWLEAVEAMRRGFTNLKRLGKMWKACECRPLSGWIPPPTHSLTHSRTHSVTQRCTDAHSPCQASPPGLIRVKQTLAEHESILHNQLQRWLIPSPCLQLTTRIQTLSHRLVFNDAITTYSTQWI